MARRAIVSLESAHDIAGLEVRDALRRCRELGKRIDWLLRRAGAAQTAEDKAQRETGKSKTPMLPGSLVKAFGAYANAVGKLSKEARDNAAAVRESLTGEDTDSIKGEMIETLRDFIGSLPKAQRAQLVAQLEDETKDVVLN